MKYLIVLILLSFNLSAIPNNLVTANVIHKKTEKKVDLPLKSNFIGNHANGVCTISSTSAFGFTFPCGPVDGICVPASCNNCTKVGLTLHCTDGCCVTSITMSSTNGNCFTCCGVIQHVTNASWNGTRSDCSPNDLTLTPAVQADKWCNGETLMFEICGNATGSLGITFTAHTDNCGDIVLNF